MKSTPYSLGPLEPLSQAQLWQACNACLNMFEWECNPHLFEGQIIEESEDSLGRLSRTSQIGIIVWNSVILLFYPSTTRYC